MNDDEKIHMIDGYLITVDKEYYTPILVEDYEGQALILAGAPSVVGQAARNKLFRIMKDMHGKIHALLETDNCEFCYTA